MFDLSLAQQESVVRDALGVDPLVVLPLGPGPHGTDALAVVPTAPPTANGGTPVHHLVVDGEPAGPVPEAAVPAWAGFCHLLVGAGDLVPDHSPADDAGPDAVPADPADPAAEPADPAVLEAVRRHLARTLLGRLILLHALDPDRWAHLAEVHHEALATAALTDPDVHDLVRCTLPIHTTHGDLTVEALQTRPGPLACADPTAWASLGPAGPGADGLVVHLRSDAVRRLLQSVPSLAPRLVLLDDRHSRAMGA